MAGDEAGELKSPRSAPVVTGGWESSQDVEDRRLRLLRAEAAGEPVSGKSDAWLMK